MTPQSQKILFFHLSKLQMARPGGTDPQAQGGASLHLRRKHGVSKLSQGKKGAQMEWRPGVTCPSPSRTRRTPTARGVRAQEAEGDHEERQSPPRGTAEECICAREVVAAAVGMETGCRKEDWSSG